MTRRSRIPVMKRTRWLVALAVAVLPGAVGIFVTQPGAGEPRRFDPKAVARSETAMWRAYYEHRRVALFLELGGLLRQQYGMSWPVSQAAAYRAAHAAILFQRGHGRTDYEKALPDLEAFYGLVRGTGKMPFDVRDAAHRELEWWIAHRERSRFGRERLVETLAGLQACLYSRPAEQFREHAEARADAMILRDEMAGAGAVTDGGWARIAGLLDRSWASLWRRVQ